MTNDNNSIDAHYIHYLALAERLEQLAITLRRYMLLDGVIDVLEAAQCVRDSIAAGMIKLDPDDTTNH